MGKFPSLFVTAGYSGLRPSEAAKSGDSARHDRHWGQDFKNPDAILQKASGSDRIPAHNVCMGGNCNRNMRRNSAALKRRCQEKHGTHAPLFVSHMNKNTGRIRPILASSFKFEVPEPRRYWEETTSEIEKELKKIGVPMLDCYLVGSGMSSQSLADIDDIDSAMILTGDYSDEEMLVIRDRLDNLLLKVDAWNKYHFRLFDEIGFRNLAAYDGYRLYEFRDDNLSFCNTDILPQSEPILNSENFTMSVRVPLPASLVFFRLAS